MAPDHWIVLDLADYPLVRSVRIIVLIQVIAPPAPLLVVECQVVKRCRGQNGRVLMAEVDTIPRDQNLDTVPSVMAAAGHSPG